ncbi:hypothetical protein ACFWMR_07320 [Amycolatopsis thailandensis]
MNSPSLIVFGTSRVADYLRGFVSVGERELSTERVRAVGRVGPQ